MGQLNDFKYYLIRKSDGKYYYIDGSGTLQTQVAAIELPYAPKGWDDNLIKWERGFTYHGVFRSYSTPLVFIREGAKILRSLYYTYGIEADCQIYIKMLDRTTLTYGDMYTGEIDFSTLQDRENDVLANIMEGGFLAKLKARENTLYEIDIETHPAVEWVKMDGLLLDCNLLWATTEEGPHVRSFGNPNFFTAVYFQNEGVNLSLGPQDVYNTPGASVFTIAQNTDDVAVDVTVNWDINFDVEMDGGNSINGDLYVRSRVLNAAGNAWVSTSNIYTSSGLVPGTTTNHDVLDSHVITLQPGESLAVQLQTNTAVSLNYASYTMYKGKITVSYESLKGESYVPVVPASEIFADLVNLISDNETANSSTLLYTTHFDKVLTSGDAIRNLEGSKLKISFADFYQSLDAIYGTALLFDKDANEVSIELKETAYDDGTLTYNLGAVASCNIAPLSDDVFANLILGYQEVTYDEINGKDEFNQQSNFKSAITRKAQTLTRKSSIRTDMYGIEYARINLGNKESTDADTDNDTFYIHIDRSLSGTIPVGFYGEGNTYSELFRTPIDAIPGASYWEISNLDHPETAFNIFFSPKRCLLRSGNYLRALLYPLTGTIDFQASTKSKANNAKMVTHEGSPVVDIDEGGNENITDLGSPLFYPFMFTITTKTPLNIGAALNSNPYGYIEFTWLGDTYYGFDMTASQQLPYREKQEFKLLATATNTLSNLIH